MFELKPLSREAVPAALEKAYRYRLLHEPVEAESICRDVLDVEPDHQEALVMLVLALSDQFEEHLGAAAAEAKAVLGPKQARNGRLERGAAPPGCITVILRCVFASREVRFRV